MSAKIVQLRKGETDRNATSGRLPNNVNRIREHLTEAETDKLLAALKRNRHGHRDWLIGLVIYRHGLRVSEACDLRWDDIDLSKRTIIVRRLKGSSDSVHYLERDEVNGLKLLHRQQQANQIKAAYVFINERGQPFGRMGIGRMIERAGEAAGLPFPVHVHMLRHSTGYALAARGMDTRRLQHFLGHASITNTVRYTAMSPEPFKDIWCCFNMASSSGPKRAARRWLAMPTPPTRIV
jgi:site-specific recombinase XerD